MKQMTHKDALSLPEANKASHYERNLFEASLDALVTISADGKIMDVNKATEKATGLPRTRLIGSDFCDYFTEPEKAKEGYLRVFSEGSVVDYPLDIRHKSGSVTQVLYNAAVYKNETGRVEGVFAAARDITKRKEAEDKLRLFSEAVENAPDAVQIVDLFGYVLYSNRAVEEMYGFSRKDYLGKHVNEMNADPEFAGKVIVPALHNSGRWDGELMVKHKSGHIFPVWLAASLVKDDKGKPLAMVGIIRDLTERKRAKTLGDALNTINMTLNSTLDFDPIMRQVAAESAQAIGSETGAIFLLEDGNWVVKYIYGLPEDIIGTKFDDEGAKGACLAARERKPVVGNDALNDPRLNPKTMRKYNIKSILIAPLIVKNEVVGALYFSNHSAAIPFDEEQVDFACKLSASISLAIKNARLYKQEREIANTLQTALLTIPERVPGVDFGHMYRSAAETAAVGGDFYDLFALDRERVGIIIGDVSGKGLEAATITSLVKNTIKAYAYHEPSPAIIISKTNEVILKASAPFIFVTVFFGILDTRSGRLAYCNAGHPPPILKRKSGMETLETGSTALGVLGDLTYPDGLESISPGDLLILYTDGVTEARCGQAFFGEQSLLRLLAQLERTSTRDVPEAIFNELLTRCRCKLTDDIAILTLSLSQKTAHSAGGAFRNERP